MRGVLADVSGLKPWQHRRRGESTQDYEHRLHHSCFRCGHYEEDLAVLDAHEDIPHSGGGSGEQG